MGGGVVESCLRVYREIGVGSIHGAMMKALETNLPGGRTLEGGCYFWYI